MKKFVIALAALFLAASALRAQSPTTTYPYLYPQFTVGKVVMDGGRTEEKKMNIHLRRDALHYLDNDIVKEAFLTDVKAVEIGTDVFVPVMGRMMKAVAKNEKGCVAEEILGDFESSREAAGAYGVPSTSSATMKLTSIQTDAQVNQNYMNILNERDNGVELRLVHNYYVVSPLYKVKATKKDITETLPENRQDAWKDFLKTHKINWKRPQSLLEVVDFLCEDGK
jgi:hypothetical protein